MKELVGSSEKLSSKQQKTKKSSAQSRVEADESEETEKSSQGKSADALKEMRIIEKFRRPFKPLRSSLLALESLKGDASSSSDDASKLGSVLSDHLQRLGDFIENDEMMRVDPEAWEFIGCFWPFQKGSTGPELRMLYESLLKQRQ